MVLKSYGFNGLKKRTINNKTKKKGKCFACPNSLLISNFSLLIVKWLEGKSRLEERVVALGGGVEGVAEVYGEGAAAHRELALKR